MRTPTTIVAPKPLRKPVSVTLSNSQAGKGVEAHTPVIARVRDSLVLRLVTKAKPSANKGQTDEPHAR